MQQIETDAIQRFLILVKRAAQTRSRDVRIEISDAIILTAEIAAVLSRVAALQDSMEAVPLTVKMDGGSLR